MKFIKIILIIFSLFTARIGFSQSDSVHINKDTIIIKDGKETLKISHKKNKPGKAAFFSAVLPGAGQVYNKKYWKVPLVYSALSTAAFMFQFNNKQYQKYLLGYQQRIDTTLEETIFGDDISTDQLLEYKNSTRRNRDLMAVAFIAVYGLNIIDAVVDAELSDFDVSDDLSLRISPEIIPISGFRKKNTIGITLCLNFK